MPYPESDTFTDESIRDYEGVIRCQLRLPKKERRIAKSADISSVQGIDKIIFSRPHTQQLSRSVDEFERQLRRPSTWGGHSTSSTSSSSSRFKKRWTPASGGRLFDWQWRSDRLFQVDHLTVTEERARRLMLRTAELKEYLAHPGQCVSSPRPRSPEEDRYFFGADSTKGKRYWPEKPPEAAKAGSRVLPDAYARRFEEYDQLSEKEKKEVWKERQSGSSQFMRTVLHKQTSSLLQRKMSKLGNQSRNRVKDKRHDRIFHGQDAPGTILNTMLRAISPRDMWQYSSFQGLPSSGGGGRHIHFSDEEPEVRKISTR